MLSPSGMILAAALTGATKVLSAPMRAKTMAEVRMNILADGVWVNRLDVGVWLEDQSGVPRCSYTKFSGPERARPVFSYSGMFAAGHLAVIL